MSADRSILLVLVLVGPALLGCGPPPLTVDGGGTTTSQSSTVAGSASESSESSGSESSGSESSGESETSSESTDPTFGFVPQGDVHGDDHCDPFAQDCPEGEKCVPYYSGSTGDNWDANKCVPVLGDQKPGEPCTHGGLVEATDDCDATSHCWDVMDFEGEAIGTCAPFCTGSPDDPQCPDSPGCNSYSCLVGNPSINLCVQTCDPLAQNCGMGLACFWANNGFNCIFTTDDFPIGEACGFINDCIGGSGCVGSELLPDCAGSACCTPFCDPSAIVDPCPELLAGTSCVVFDVQRECPVGRCLASP